MRNPEVVLSSLEEKAKVSNYKFQRLYRNLYNREFFLTAYDNIYAKEGNMTEGTDGKTIDGMSLERIDSLIEKLKDESYQPKPSKRKYIAKKNGSDKRPLGIPSFDDKLIQEVVRMILESVYEPKFSKHSHGFRPKRSCHTALEQIKATFNRTKWFVEGDIKGFFDNIDHNILIKILSKHIDDAKFIRLIWKFLKAGYMEDWKFHNTHSGTPQGGIISPILANVYLNELDLYMVKFKTMFDKGKGRKYNPEWKRLDFQMRKRKKWIDEKNLDEEEVSKLKKEIKELLKERQTVKALDPMDENYRRIQYVRYADDFLISVIGNKRDAEYVKESLTKFLEEELNLELSQEKTLVTHNSNFVRFLGYDITTWQKPYIRKGSDRRITMTYGHIVFYLPKEVWVNKLVKLNAIKKSSINEETWLSKSRPELINYDDLEIISIYNAEILGLYNYYKLASNVSVLSNFWWIMHNSMLKTYASKYKSSRSKVNKKFLIDGKFGIKYDTKQGQKVRYFVERSFAKQVKTVVNTHMEIDTLPNTNLYKGRTSLIDRLLAEKCEWCGAENVPLEIHHVRKLKDLKGKDAFERTMIERRRKTIALCANGYGNSCHGKLHNNKL